MTASRLLYLMQRVTTILILSLLFGTRPGVAAADLASKVAFDIPPQPLPSALLKYSEQSGVQVTSRGELIEGKESNGVVGTFPASRALEALLKGTELAYDVIDRGTVAIRHSGTKRRMAASGVAVARGNEHVALAQADDGAGVPSLRTQSEGVPDAAPDRTTIDEIVVVGSRLGSVATESAQPVKVLTREYIDRTGAGSLSQVLSTLPEVSVNASGTAQQGIAGTTQVQLRGLPVGTTLVLINGRRIATSGLDTRSGAFNLGTVPLDVVERIEVLPSGSSAVHGGDALGGVVNIVLRKELSGVSATARYGTADGFDESQGSIAWGHAWSKASLSVIGSYSRNNALAGGERALTSDEDFRRFGGPDLRSLNGNPGTVYSVNSQNLPGLSARLAAVPSGSTGIGLTPADFAATAGIENRWSNGAMSALFHPGETYGAFLSGAYELTPALALFMEVFYSTFETNTFQSPATFQRNVPASNPFNPFGTTVQVRHRLDGIGGSETEHTEEYLRPLIGARGALRSWSWEVAGWMSDSNLERLTTRRVLNLAALDAALASSDPNVALNVFRDGPAGSQQQLASLFGPDEFVEFETGLRSASALMRGALADLPAGALETLFGAEHERSVLDFAPGTVSAVDAERDSYALFSEFRVPLWSRSTSTRSQQVLSLNGAVRYDHYDDFGNRTSTGAGLEFRPIESLLLRASYADAFKPPVLHQLFAPPTTSPATVTDPELGQRYTVSNVLIGGNSSLSPQTGEAYTVGIVFSPRTVPGLDVALTHWDNHLDSGFTSPTAQYIVDNAGLFPGRVVRDGTGRIIQIDTSWINFGYLDQAGFDFTASWRKATGLGSFRPSLSVANTHRYETQAIVNAPPQDGVGKANSDGFAPRWKGNVSLGWEYGDLSATVTGRYVGEYRDYRPLTDGSFRVLGDRLWVDFNAQYDAGELIRGIADTSVVLGAVNAFDAEPEYSTFFSYDPRQDDIRGRFLYAQLRVRF